MTVTTVDSGNKALEFLGLHQHDPCVSPHAQQVMNVLLLMTSCFLKNFFLILVLGNHVKVGFIFFDSYCFHERLISFLCCLEFARSGSKSCYHRLLYAWNDRL